MSQNLPAGQDKELNNLPDWMRQMAGAAETPSWLHRLLRDCGELPVDLSPADVPLVEPVEAVLVEPEQDALDQDIPDWLEQAGDLSSNQVQPLIIDAGEQGEVVDWLSGLREQVTPPAEQETSGALESTEAAPDWFEGITGVQDTAQASEVDAFAAAPGEELPDWLSGFGDAGEEAAAQPETQTGLPDWFSDVGDDVAEPAASAPGEQEAIPDWLAGAETAPQVPPDAAAVEAPEIPDWLRGTAPESAAPAGFVASEPEEIPAWLTGAVPETRAVEAAPASSTEAAPPAEEGMPDWLAGIGEEAAPAEEGAPDWLAGIGEEAEAAEESAPDWLAGIGEEAEAPPAEEGAPDWLAGIGEEAEAAEEGAPDWLAGIGEEAEAAPAEEGASDWLAGIGEEAEEGAPDWLAGIGEEAEAAPAAPADLDDQAGTPAWLTQVIELEQEPAVETAPETHLESTIDVEQQAPDWLQDMGAMPTEPEKKAPKGVTAWLQDIQDSPMPEEEVVEAAPQGSPDWLEEIDLIESDELAAQALGQEVPVELPDWLQESEFAGSDADAEFLEEIMAVSPQVGAPGDAIARPGHKATPVIPADADLASWIADLQAQTPDELPKEAPAETSGPLTGLRGLLAPEPLLAISPRSKYAPTQPMPESWPAEAKLFEEILALTPAQPVSVSEAPGQLVLASLGRWAIYAALLLAIVIAAFLPDTLSGLISPPKMEEARAFYNTLDELAPDSVVLLAVDYDASLDGELSPQARAIIRHLLYQQVRIVAVSITPQGVAIVQELFDENAGFVPGQHYINLGYLPPHPASLYAFIGNPVGGTTFLGASETPAQTPLGQRIAQFEGFDLIIPLSGNQEHVRWWIEQIASQYPIDIAAGVSASISPYLLPYYEAPKKQIQGMLVGLAGAAYYESLLDPAISPDYAQNNLVLQGYAQFVLVAILMASGVTFLLKRPRPEKQ